MFNAFITGSRAYGSPKKSSDVDLVILVSPEHLEVLAKMADSDDSDKVDKSDSGPQWEGGKSKSLRFGRMNLLCLTDPIAYAVWLVGTNNLVAEYEEKGPVERDKAVDYLGRIRRHTGLYTTRPRVRKDYEDEPCI